MADKFRIPALDGFRAIAALIVFISHAGLHDWIPGGFGVSVFFFLSGYLITTLMRQEYERGGTVSLKNFYLRRFYRIAPPLYLMFTILLTLSVVHVMNSDLSLGGVAAGVLQLTNYYVIDYGVGHLVPHSSTFWSLSVEEHFYFLFPILFLFLVKRCSYRRIAMVFAGLCLAEFVWRLILVDIYHAPPIRTYLSSDTRMDSILFGSILAVWYNPVLDVVRNPFGSVPTKLCVLAASVTVLLFTFLYRNIEFRESLRYSLQGAALFPIFWLAVRHAEWPLFRLLDWKPLRFIGSISYTFYLSHVLWLHFCSYLFESKLMSAIVAFAMTIVFSTLVYQIVERPFARLRQRLHRRSADQQAMRASQNEFRSHAAPIVETHSQGALPDR